MKIKELIDRIKRKGDVLMMDEDEAICENGVHKQSCQDGETSCDIEEAYYYSLYRSKQLHPLKSVEDEMREKERRDTGFVLKRDWEELT